MIKNFIPAMISGILVGTSYIPFYPWALFFCYIPLWRSLLKTQQSYKTIFFKAWVTQFVLTLIGFHWIYFVGHEFGFLPKPVAFIVLLLFSSLAHLHIPVASLMSLWLARKIPLSVPATAIVLALNFALLEILWPMIFKWHLGYTLLFANWPIFQLAEFVGFQGLSVLILLSQAWILIMFQSHRRKGLIQGGLLASIWLALNVLGLTRADHIQEQPFETFSFGIVQANIGNTEKYFAEKGQGYQLDIIKKYFQMTQELLKKTQPPEKPLAFVVWPEVAIPDLLDESHKDRKYSRLFHEQLKTLGVPLVTGGYSSDPIDRVPRRDFNGLFAFDENGAPSSTPYRKTHLLAFGEYLPFSDYFPELKKYNPAGSGFSRGSGPQLLFLGTYQVGAQICYESLDPFFSNKLKQLGADFIINVTNDSWFGPHSEPEQHLYMTLARSIETRLPLIRATNTGISTVIDNLGTLGPQSPQGTAWAEVLTLKKYSLKEKQTFYSQYALILPFLIVLLVILTCVKGQVWIPSTGKKS
jgi:apolipoprotein N-acyltransferase